MRIVAIAALHSAFENLVVERQIELVLNFRVTAQTKLGFARFQQLQHRETRLLSVCLRDEYVRTGPVLFGFLGMRRVAISTPHVVAPMFTTPEVVVFFLARMARQTRFGDFF